jgi:nicotinamidase/pyrazinamidase
MALKVQLVVIDPQNDFMGEDNGDPYTVQMGTGTQRSTLPVAGAVSDMQRLAEMLDRVSDKIEGVQVTLDSHRVIDVGHPGMWRNSNGDSPGPLTMISVSDIENDIWYPRRLALKQRLLDYARALAAKGNYPLMIWPEHCLIGSWGHNVQADLAAALQRWERARFKNVDYVVKGTNAFTEHYGALEAEVPDPSDPSTQLNAAFLQILQNADIVAVGGEASSHCVLSTVRQIADNIGVDHIKKFHILTDGMSPVGAVPNGGPDFPAIASAFFADMATKGMTLTTTDKFLA